MSAPSVVVVLACLLGLGVVSPMAHAQTVCQCGDGIPCDAGQACTYDGALCIAMGSIGTIQIGSVGDYYTAPGLPECGIEVVWVLGWCAWTTGPCGGKQAILDLDHCP